MDCGSVAGKDVYASSIQTSLNFINPSVLHASKFQNHFISNNA